MPVKIADVMGAAAPSGQSLTYHLIRALQTPRRARSHTVVHASDGDPGDSRPEFCPRESALRDILARPRPPETPGAPRRFTWDVGNLLADYVTRVLQREVPVIGDWRCMACGEYVRATASRAGCPRCGAPWHQMRYEEVVLCDEETGVSASIDLIVDIGDPSGWRIVECKTLDKEPIKALVAPRAEHRWRTSLYLWMVERARESSDPVLRELCRRINPDVAKIVYITKGGFGAPWSPPLEWGLYNDGWTPFVEFDIERGPFEEVAEHLGKALAYKNFRDEGVMPYGVCGHDKCPRAQACGVLDACFSGQYPAGQTVVGHVPTTGST